MTREEPCSHLSERRALDDRCGASAVQTIPGAASGMAVVSPGVAVCLCVTVCVCVCVCDGFPCTRWSSVMGGGDNPAPCTPHLGPHPHLSALLTPLEVLRGRGRGGGLPHFQSRGDRLRENSR